MPPKLQTEWASMLTDLYCVIMIKAKNHQLFKGEHAQTHLWSNFESTKCCGYFEYKIKVN